MSLTEKITFCIPTKNRPEFLSRLLNYYAITSFDGWIFIGDSSEGKYLENNKVTVEEFQGQLMIRHFILPSRRVNAVLEKLCVSIKTPFCLGLTDDDFVITSSIEKCIEFLEKNSEYVAVHGRGAIIGLDQRGAYGNINYINSYPQAIIEADTGAGRLKEYLNPPRAEAYSVHRTEVWANMFTGFSEYDWAQNQKITIDELICCGIAAIRGKIKELDCLYLVRQGGHDFQVKRVDFYDLITHPLWSISIQDMYNRFTEELVIQDNVDTVEAQALIKEAFFPHFVREFNQLNRMIKSKEKIIIQKGSMIKKVFSFFKRYKKLLPDINFLRNVLFRIFFKTKKIFCLQARQLRNLGNYYKTRKADEISLAAIKQTSSTFYEDFKPIFLTCKGEYV